MKSSRLSRSFSTTRTPRKRPTRRGCRSSCRCSASRQSGSSLSMDRPACDARSFPSHCSSSSTRPTWTWLRPFREVADALAADVKPSEQPLYLSRRRLTSRQRPVVGEPELEELLRDNGFAIAYPETMTIEDQVRLINSHADIFSSLGSAAHSILFALGKPRLHLLASRDDIPPIIFSARCSLTRRRRLSIA